MIAMSSTCSASFENTSLTSIPDLPWRLNLNGDAYATPPTPGMDLPLCCASAGFGSHVSTCDGAPCANMCTMCFALAGQCGFFGRVELSDSALASSADNPCVQMAPP